MFTGCALHLVHPLGFEMTEKQLRRAGLDYGDMAAVSHYDSIEKFRVEHLATANVDDQGEPETAVCFSTKGTKPFHQHSFSAGQWLLFGSETRGLDTSVLEQFPDDQILRLPMLSSSRSMNLSNTVAVAVYEAWRQCDFKGS